ncbi:ATP-binding cassette subfamily C protein [Nonomuraea fuscirosea]|uniref:ATP-binding cassette subfamily C protein n=1 Tax=Nonomuraea fuscirosea TaxID=1291556 RepID=A0A2T0MTW7_9ACTN|nr:ATP-binding cassette domain-containing protein [Nonomuraea fuscirosea]PRX62133.1 ATP-binding cassette subfamily C protein [Nonomuraea fuscirosea]
MKYAALLRLAGTRRLLPFMLLSAGAATLGPLSTVPLGLLVSHGGAMPLITLLLALLAQELCTALREPTGTATARRIDGVLRGRVRTVASNLPLALLETPATQADLRLALHGHRGRTPGTAAVAAAGEASRLTSALLGAAILALHVWWAALLALSLALLQNRRIATMLVGPGGADTLADSPAQARRRRRADYLSEVAGGPGAAKELRVFSLQPFFIDRYVTAMRAFLTPQSRGRRAVVRGYGTVLALQLLSAAGTFALLAWHTGTGLLGPGDLARCVLAALLVFAYGAGSHQMFELAHASEPYNATLRLLTPTRHRSTPDHATIAPETTRNPRAPKDVSSVRTVRIGDASAPESASLARLATDEDAFAPTRTSSIRDGSVLALDGVTFAYPGAATPLLRDLHLHVHPGERLAIVGRNGAGKTTLAKLLTGLYTPTTGTATIGTATPGTGTPGTGTPGTGTPGTGIATFGTDTSTGTTGVATTTSATAAAVFQDFIRYPLSLRDNVSLGDPAFDGTDADVLSALESADALDLLDVLPDGLDTPLSRAFTRGRDLSGGQWQKVALARAMYALHPHGRQILIVDEPTAHLDARAEREIFERLLQRTRGRTLILISHRFATVRRADRIVVLDGGAIAEEGDHAELLAANGHYAHWYHLQANLITQDAP